MNVFFMWFYEVFICAGKGVRGVRNQTTYDIQRHNP